MALLIQPSLIKNNAKRQEVANKHKKAKGKKTSETAGKGKARSKRPCRKEALAENVPCTLDNACERDPSMLPTSIQPSSSVQVEELNADLASDSFAVYFNFTDDPHTPPKVLITTSPKASKAIYDVCDELVGVFPGAEYVRRKKGKAGRGYKYLVVVNEDMKEPNVITLVHLPNGPTAYFRLTSAHARATPHNPELVLNNFATSLGPAGRQVVMLHNQRDFLFFRRHRYAFRSPEKVALQEIGLPEVHNFGASPETLEITTGITEESAPPPEEVTAEPIPLTKNPPKENEYLWRWKPEQHRDGLSFFDLWDFGESSVIDSVSER
ncbi:anticodon-binding protein, partial [Scleroderma citrinum]